MAIPLPEEMIPLQKAGEEFHMYIGLCIAAWASAENQIFRICWKAIGCKQERAAIIYFKSPSLETRVTLTQELVAGILPKTVSGKPIHSDLKTWTEIIKRFNALKTIRNRIAHHPVSYQATVKGILGSPIGTMPVGGRLYEFWFENYVSYEERLRGRHEGIKPLTLKDLKEHQIDVSALTSDLHKFLQKLSTYL